MFIKLQADIFYSHLGANNEDRQWDSDRGSKHSVIRTLNLFPTPLCLTVSMSGTMTNAVFPILKALCQPLLLFPIHSHSRQHSWESSPGWQRQSERWTCDALSIESPDWLHRLSHTFLLVQSMVISKKKCQARWHYINNTNTQRLK